MGFHLMISGVGFFFFFLIEEIKINMGQSYDSRVM